MLRSLYCPIHKDGWRFVIPAAIATYFLYKFHFSLGTIGLVLTIWCYYFFRNPKRMVPQENHLLLSPADGKVEAVVIDTPPIELGLDSSQTWRRISVFLNVFNVHVNRIPLGGEILKVIYHPGKFLNAASDKASKDNERNSLVVKHSANLTYACVQIAGLVARRIRCDVEEKDNVKSGQYFGLIRFGSRMDVYIPEDIAPLVVPGQITIAGETVLADIRHKGPPREGKWL